MYGETMIYMGSFMGQPMCTPPNTTYWQNSAFTWVISWADQYEAHIIPMCEQKIIIHGQFFVII